MKFIHTNYTVEQIFLKDDGMVPNSHLPVIIYKGVLTLPTFFSALFIKILFSLNNWKNAWTGTVQAIDHYHSVTHEVLGVIQGRTSLWLGGVKGRLVFLKKGDVIIIPAGVEHKNLEPRNEFKCVGAYPNGKDFDMNYGRSDERPKADHNIMNVPLPTADPLFGANGRLLQYWKNKGK